MAQRPVKLGARFSKNACRAFGVVRGERPADVGQLEAALEIDVGPHDAALVKRLRSGSVREERAVFVEPPVERVVVHHSPTNPRRKPRRRRRCGSRRKRTPAQPTPAAAFT
jgi:hypothetical protein